MRSLVLFLCWGFFAVSVAETPPVRSPWDVRFSPDGCRVAVSDATAGRVSVVDAGSGRLTGEVRVAGSPRSLAWRDSVRVLVAEYDADAVAEIDTQRLEVTRRLAAGPKAVGLCVLPRRGWVVVGDYGLAEVRVLRLSDGDEVSRWRVAPQPYFLTATPGEDRVVVGHLIPPPTDNPLAAAAVVSVLNLDRAGEVRRVTLPLGSSNLRQVAIRGDGRRAAVVHTRGRVALPTSQVERGWVNNNALSILDLEAGTVWATVLLDFPTRGGADPWGIALAPDGGTAWVSLAGAQELARVDLGGLETLLRAPELPRWFRESDAGALNARAIWEEARSGEVGRRRLADELSALAAAGLLDRRTVDLQGPRGLAVSPDGRRVAVAGYFSGDLLLGSIEEPETWVRVSLGPVAEPEAARVGEALFHDGRQGHQSWLSCATCHPEGASVDGLGWDLLNDGVGNPKNTRTLVRASLTPPTTYLGVRRDAGVSVEAGFRHLLFREPGVGQVEAVLAYLGSLSPGRSPHLVRGGQTGWQLSPQAQRGRDLFFSQAVGCAECHPEGLWTDLRSHDVGTRGVDDSVGLFDTPALVELWRTAPYLHDGSARTLRGLLTTANLEDRHGRTARLTGEEVEALVAFLLSL